MRTKCGRRQQGENDGVTRLIALKDFTLDERRGCSRAKFLLHFLLSLSKGQCLRLRKEIGQEDTMMLGAIKGVVGSCRCQEVCGDELGTLMKQLIERVLPIGTGRTPDDWLCDISDGGRMAQPDGNAPRSGN